LLSLLNPALVSGKSVRQFSSKLPVAPWSAGNGNSCTIAPNYGNKMLTACNLWPMVAYLL